MDSTGTINDINDISSELDQLTVSKAYKCPPTLCANKLGCKNGLKIFHLNVRSINKNFDGLIVLLNRLDFQCDVIILSECWLSKAPVLPILDGYVSYWTKNIHNQNDGVAIYIRSHILCDVTEPQFIGANCLVCKVGTKCCIVALYRSPSFTNITTFNDSLQNVLGSLSNFSTLAVVGDINIDIKPGSTDANCSDYLNLTAMHGLLPAHLFPTRLNNCIDHVLLRTTTPAVTLVLETYITDHQPLILFIDNLKPKLKPPKSRKRLDYAAVQTQIEETDWTAVLSASDANEAADILVYTLSKIIKKHTLVSKIPRQNRKIKPWITPGLLRCIAHRDSLHEQVSNSPGNSILLLTYKRYRNYCNELLRKLKRSYETGEFMKAKHSPKATWDVINRVANLKSKPAHPTELINPNEPLSSINKVNKYFSSIGREMADKISSRSRSAGVIPHNNNNLSSMVLLETDADEVDRILTNLKPDSAAGWDEIPVRVLNSSRCTLVPLITHICNRAIATGIFPRVFKKAVVHPVFKTGDRGSVTNYRPISVLTALSKILERILNNRLAKFLETNKTISGNQYGFRTGISTEDAVLALTEHAVRNLDKKHKCLGLFLDLAKAFDTVSVPILLDKLERIGVRGIPLKIFNDYLHDRVQVVKIGDLLSGEEKIDCGVPQGSILGPTLFILFINELCNVTLPNCKIFTYADDTALIVDGDDWDQTKHNAEHALRIVMDWLSDNLLTLNVDKTLFIPFAMRADLQPPESFAVKAHTCLMSSPDCCCLNISRSPCVKYLGVHIDQSFRWHKQIEIATARARRLIFIFKRLRQSADTKTLRLVYLALCQSLFTYCLTVWGGAPKSTLLQLEIAQRAVLKVMTKRPFRYPTAQLYDDCKVLTVRQLYIFKTITRKHKSRPLQEPRGRIRYTVFKLDRTRTFFACKHYFILSVKLYNKANKHLNLFHLDRICCKMKVRDWLAPLTYQETEDLLTDIAR